MSLSFLSIQTMRTRLANINDLRQLSLLFDEYRVFYEQVSDVQKAKIFLADRIVNGESTIFIAENEFGIMAGFIQLYPIFSSTRMRRLWLLNDLYVHPNYRGQQVGVLLMEQSQRYCIETNACGIILETAKSNLIGNSLYPKVGFTLDDAHNYYSWDNIN